MLLDTFRRKFKEVKAEMAGQAMSQGRRIMPLEEINDKLLRPKGAHGPAQPTGIMVRMKNGNPMRYFNDGSLRHAHGARPSRAARRALKKKQQAERRALVH